MSNQHSCRICSDQYELIRVCKCSGSIEWIHKQCIINWLDVKYPNGRWKEMETITCELCKQPINIPMTIMEKVTGLYSVQKYKLSKWWIHTKYYRGLNLCSDYRIVWVIVHTLLFARFNSQALNFQYVFQFGLVYLFIFVFIVNTIWRILVVDHKLKLEIMKSGMIRQNKSLSQLEQLKPGTVLESTNQQDHSSQFYKQRILIIKQEGSTVIGIALNKDQDSHFYGSAIFKSGGPVLAPIVTCLTKRPHEIEKWEKITNNVQFRFMTLNSDLKNNLQKGIFYQVGFTSWLDQQLAGELSAGSWILSQWKESELWDQLRQDQHQDNQQLEQKLYHDDQELSQYINDYIFTSDEQNQMESEEEDDDEEEEQEEVKVVKRDEYEYQYC